MAMGIVVNEARWYRPCVFDSHAQMMPVMDAEKYEVYVKALNVARALGLNPNLRSFKNVLKRYVMRLNGKEVSIHNKREWMVAWALLNTINELGIPVRLDQITKLLGLRKGRKGCVHILLRFGKVTPKRGLVRHYLEVINERLRNPEAFLTALKIYEDARGLIPESRSVAAIIFYIASHIADNPVSIADVTNALNLSDVMVRYGRRKAILKKIGIKEETLPAGGPAKLYVPKPLCDEITKVAKIDTSKVVCYE